jgi:pimeloyl-ACP methyl ester carboxylesterase
MVLFVIFSVLVVLFFGVHVIQVYRLSVANQAILETGGHSVDIESRRLYYREFGERGERPALVLIHGFMGSSADFLEVAPQLAKQYHVIAVDLVPFGRSDHVPENDFSKAEMARLTSELLKKLKIEKYHLLGHSMGGEVALRIALKEPDHVDKLILVDSGGLESGPVRSVNPWLIRIFFKNYIVQRLVFGSTVNEVGAGEKRYFDRLFTVVQGIPAEALSAMTRENDSGGVSDQIKEIQKRTLILWGMGDAIIPLSQGVELSKRLSGSTLITLENVGHIPFVEAPETFVDAVLNFLSE